MRKAFFAFAITFLCFQLQAQNSSPYWSLAGNSNASTSSKLGTTNAIPLRLYTKNSERMRIDTLGRVGIGTTSPGSQLQVNSASGVSPLKVQINGSTKLYMSSGGGLSVGSGSTSPSNGLYVSGNVGIGTTTPAYKLQVEGGTGTAIYGNGDTYGVVGHSSDAGTAVYGTGGGIGVYGDALVGVKGQGADGVEGISLTGSGGNGVYGSADESNGVKGTSNSGYGVYGSSSTLYTSNGSTGVYGTGFYGVQGIGSEGVYAASSAGGGDGLLVRSSGSSNYAVNAISTNSFGVYASTGDNTSYAGFFAGNVYASGTYTGSDRKLKKNITDFSSAMDIISKLQPKSYEYRQDGNYKLMNLPEGKHYGLIAQDLELVLPTLVKDTKFDVSKATPAKQPESTSPQQAQSIDFKAVNYTELIPILVKAVQEEDAKNQQLEARIEKLEALLANGSTAVNKTALSPATPNPASGTTRISYTLPTGSSHAQLLVTDATGKTIKAIALNGSGSVDVNTSSLSSGVYNYSLLLDGKQVDTKRLVIAR